MGLAVTVLGSSAMYASTERAASGYLLDLGGTNIWLDAGGGTWQNLLRCGDYRSLAGVLLTHRHPDHTIDLFQAFHARHYGDATPLEPIPLWAPRETIAHLTSFANDLGDSFHIVPLEESSVIEIGGARVSFTSMTHPSETLGVRVESETGVFAYSSDTGSEADFRQLAAGADVFVCEATLQDSDEKWWGHMRASQAARAASEAGARSLVLSHLPHERDLEISVKEARAAADVDVSLAEDLRRIEVGA